MATSKHTLTDDSRDLHSLTVAVKAVEAAEHNPVEWMPIIRLVAPIVARIAARYAIKAISRKVSGRISPKVRGEVATKTADYVGDIVTKRVGKVTKTKK